MAGIYIHIPFCRQICHYCDFYKSVNSKDIPVFLSALKNEIVGRKFFLEGEGIETIYFGGGTPSVLKERDFSEILELIHREFRVNAFPEVTMEANPDDLDSPYLQVLRRVGFNRLSIGIQAFQEDILQKLNRRHTARQAVESVIYAEREGFEHISVDLIFGLPGMTLSQWEHNLDQAFQLPVDHLSAYSLTFHEGTPFYRWRERGILEEIGEEESIAQYTILLDEAVNAGFEHYEISNFARDKQYSRHNTGYWTGKKYLGLGPSAHSYDGTVRRWNVADIKEYIEGLNSKKPFSQQEIITENERYNEYILTGLRTKWGVSVEVIRKQFGEEKAHAFLQEAAKYLRYGKMIREGTVYALSREGFFISDDIMAGFMII